MIAPDSPPPANRPAILGEANAYSEPSMPPADRQPFLSRGVALAIVLALVAVLAGAGWQIYQRFFFEYTPLFRASEPIFQAARQNKALTADEFARALALSDCGVLMVELKMANAIDIAVAANPGYKSDALALYTRLAADPSDPRRQAQAAKRVTKLSGPP